ncbi:hypothetical protein [Streptomyces sp. NPDC002559]
MDWTQLLKQLVGAMEVCNRRVASLRTTGIKNPCAAVVLLGVAVGQRFTADSAFGARGGGRSHLVPAAGVGATGLALVPAELGRRGTDAEYGTAGRFQLTHLCGGLLLLVAMVLLNTLPGVTYLAEAAFHGSFAAVSLAQVCGLILLVVRYVRARGKDEPMPVVAQPTISSKA